ncbi:MAG: hypothetical protein K2M16_05560, partial [Muribaculaceae bacterium]|nr:hypothetical protein [Muribaculaceae bacterium]
ENSSGKTTHMMTSETTLIPPSHKFIINGRVASDLPDSCYNIYIADIDKEITESDLVACIPVKNRQFRFETDLSTMKTGRIRAIMPGNKLCSAWIQIYFIPGFTVDMTVHNGFYDIHNESEYKFMANAWLNQDAMAALCNTLGFASDPQNGSENSSIEKAISIYQKLLADLSEQLKQTQNLKFGSVSFIQEETKRILNQMDQVNLKMQELIDKYANSIKF